MSDFVINFTAEQEKQAQEIIAVLEKARDYDKGTLTFGNDSKKQEFVDAVLEKWGPAAEQLGLGKIQSELNDLAVRIGYPEDYQHLKRLLQEAEASCELVFKTFALPLRAMLDELGIDYVFEYRMKSVYSIWRKMRVDNKQFDDVYDLFASRIVYKPKSTIEPMMADNCVDVLPEVNAVKEKVLKEMDTEKYYCWRIYTIISSLYRIHPDRIKNWITNPKPSGYQALQLTVMGPDCNWIEIQVRSERMHYEAEQGIAAHWKYKQETAVK